MLAVRNGVEALVHGVLEHEACVAGHAFACNGVGLVLALVDVGVAETVQQVLVFTALGAVVQLILVLLLAVGHRLVALLLKYDLATHTLCALSCVIVSDAPLCLRIADVVLHDHSTDALHARVHCRVALHGATGDLVVAEVA